MELGLTRGIYIDSDTMIRDSIADLLTLDVGTACVAARVEPFRAETRAASAMNGLSEHEYFNSGVLVFNFHAPEFDQCMERALATLHDPNVNLMFHDQCALNIGFRNKSKKLPAEYNYYVDCHTEPFSDLDGRIFHFLDRPKPWDVAYDGVGSAFLVSGMGGMRSDPWRKNGVRPASTSPGVVR